MTGAQPFPRNHRVLRGEDFERVYRRRRSAADQVLLVYGCENDLEYPRLGLSVSRKVGGAVTRNRWKRLIREAFRTSREVLPAGVDLVVAPRRPVPASMAEIRESLTRLASQIERRLAKKSS